jgi:lipopolysaccharide export system protein LptC
LRNAPTRERIARRRCIVGLTKRALPVVALALLCSIALWPEISRDTARARLSFQRGGFEVESGQVVNAHYNGVDERNRPYTMTAATAHQNGPERVDLVEPKADIQLESGSWLMVQAHKGVFIQHTNQLDLSDDVTLYRDDGMTLHTSSAAIDLKAGAAAGSDMVHIEGPFGTVDAQGFTLTDRGNLIRFTGPGRLVLNGSGH